MNLKLEAAVFDVFIWRILIIEWFMLFDLSEILNELDLTWGFKLYPQLLEFLFPVKFKNQNKP